MPITGRWRYAGLLTTGVTLFFLAHHAHAMSQECETIQTLEPISSHYVRLVLERADDGLQYAQEAPANTDFDRYRTNWANAVGSTWQGLVDENTTRIATARQLEGNTACMQVDLLLIQCKMEEARDEMNAQLERGSVGALIRLQDLVEFLFQRMQHVQLGGLDPLYSDPGWGQRYQFDRPSTNVWCCLPDGDASCTQATSESCTNAEGIEFQTLHACTLRGCTAPTGTTEEQITQTMMCPFDTDYAPAFQNGYGCDIDLLTARSSYEPVRVEREGLQKVSEQVDAYRQSAQDFLSVQHVIDDLFGNISTTPPPPEQRYHKEMAGCATPIARCAQGEEGKCDDDLPSLRARRGPFSVDVNHVEILSDFLDLRASQELSRSVRSDLQTPAEQQEEGVANALLHPISTFFEITRNAERRNVERWSRDDARQEVTIFALAVDAQRQIEKAFEPLRDAVGGIARMARNRDGVRGFAVRLAAFLRRTCITRQCNLILEQIVRIANTDDCFPYTNGEYLSDTKEDPRWEKCKNSARIQ